VHVRGRGFAQARGFAQPHLLLDEELRLRLRLLLLLALVAKEQQAIPVLLDLLRQLRAAIRPARRTLPVDEPLARLCELLLRLREHLLQLDRIVLWRDAHLLRLHLRLQQPLELLAPCKLRLVRLVVLELLRLRLILLRARRELVLLVLQLQLLLLPQL
jgi:hypothetical protein